MQIMLKVQQVSSLSRGMVRLVLARHGIKTKIQPIAQNEEQKMVQDMVNRVQHAFEENFPGGVIVGGGQTPIGRKFDAVIDMQITEDEYSQIGKPGIGDIIEFEINKEENDLQ
ncbi:hypothetical protein AC481_02130 [miscellaneous Crenarchaeota group archaeon SMTZ-80]|nr:MAG: hypothetical protein AC481_02130 [miscellaneous Crenarchaeota group archaeon SMTZ-80]